MNSRAGVGRLLSAVLAAALTASIQGLNDFELICFFVVK